VTSLCDDAGTDPFSFAQRTECVFAYLVSDEKSVGREEKNGKWLIAESHPMVQMN
jgi:hypothetical protein